MQHSIGRARGSLVALLAAIAAAAGCDDAPLASPPCPGGALFCNRASEAGLTADVPLLGKGAAFVDVDSDGWEDVWLSDGGTKVPGASFKSRLFRNRADGTFEEIDAGIAPEDSKYNWAGVWGDIDSDGDPDLFLVNGSFTASPWPTTTTTAIWISSKTLAG